ncbi:MAG TPA: outer membrane protein transport protein [Candidatus Methylomirabilis sp.]|nr:outer membrane protein transport protein [Candidatus Methylomirabilis sp.]
MKTAMKRVIGAAWLTVVLAGHASAGGLWFYEQSTPDQGTAVAGRAAMARDASTAYGNPAGMSRLDDTQFLIGAGALILQSNFETEPGTTVSGGGANLTSALPDLSAFYVYSLSRDWKLGVAFTPLMGLAADYGDSWAGRYLVEKESLVTLSLNPVVSYRVTDWLSVGGGMSVVGAFFSSQSAINNPDPTLGDGELKLKSTAIGFGGNVGVLVEPIRGTRFGVTYRSPVNLHFNDIVDEVRNVGPGLNLILDILGRRFDVPRGSKVDFAVVNPQEMMFSVYHDLTRDLSIMGNFGWQNWKSFGNASVTIHGLSTIDASTDLHFSNTYHWAIGAMYRVAPAWLLTGGFAYDTSPVAENNRTVLLPLDRQIRYSAGVQYDLSKSTTLGVAYTLISTGDAPVNQDGGPLRGTVVGHYQPNFVHTIGLNFSHRF